MGSRGAAAHHAEAWQQQPSQRARNQAEPHGIGQRFRGHPAEVPRADHSRSPMVPPDAESTSSYQHNSGSSQTEPAPQEQEHALEHDVRTVPYSRDLAMRQGKGEDLVQ